MFRRISWICFPPNLRFSIPFRHIRAGGVESRLVRLSRQLLIAHIIVLFVYGVWRSYWFFNIVWVQGGYDKIAVRRLRFFFCKAKDKRSWKVAWKTPVKVVKCSWISWKFFSHENNRLQAIDIQVTSYAKCSPFARLFHSTYGQIWWQQSPLTCSAASRKYSFCQLLMRTWIQFFNLVIQ